MKLKGLFILPFTYRPDIFTTFRPEIELQVIPPLYRTQRKQYVVYDAKCYAAMVYHRYLTSNEKLQ